MRSEKFSNILVVNPYGIGDVLFTTPLIKNLKRNFPHCFLACLLGSRTRQVLEKNPFVDEIFVFDKGKFDKSSLKDRLKMLFSLVRDLKKIHFDLIIDISNAPEYSFLAKFFLGIKTSVGFDYKGRGRFLTKRIKIGGYNDKHIIEYYLDLIRLLDVRIDEDKKIDLFLDEEDRKFAGEFLENNGYKNKEKLLGVIPGGGKSWGKDAVYKHWPKENFAWVANQAIEKLGFKILILGGDEEFDICRDVEKILGAAGNKCINACSKTNLRQSAALMAKCEVALANDSGPLHMAVSQGVKTISFFGPVDEKVYGPYPPSDRHKVFTAGVDCRPCYRNFKFEKCRQQVCLLGIKREEVFEKIKTFSPDQNPRGEL